LGRRGRGRRNRPVVDEHVVRAVRVAGDEVGRRAVERDQATVGRKDGPCTGTVSLGPAGGDAHALGRTRLPVVHEHVGRAVRVAGDEVGRRAVEGDEATIGREDGPCTEAVSLAPARRDAYPLGRARLPVVDEQVGCAVRVAGDEVGRIALEGDQAAVGRERGEGEEAAAVAGPLRPTAGGDAHPLRCASLPVVDEHVGLAVRIADDEVGRIALERDEAAVGREGGVAADVVGLGPVGGDAHARGHARLPVADEHVGRAVRVADDEVGRIALKRDQTAVGREGGAQAGGVALGAARGDAHALGRARQPVADEHVGRAVRVAGDEAGRKADERDEAAVGRERRGEGEANEAAAAVALSPAGGDAHPFGRARLPVVDEHVGHAVRVGGDEVGRSAVEGDEAAVGREGGA